MSQDPRATEESSLDAGETIQPGQALPPGTGSGGGASGEVFGTESGQRFGRYELREVIGAGAMGTVYRAWHSDLQHEVALKVPKLDGPNVAERKERFYREARSAVMLRHENICRVFDLDEVDGQLFIAMEFVEGKPLSSFVRPEQPLSEKKAAVIVRRLAMALGHAHEHGVVHRDLKPDNIMISAKSKQPIVMDFGLVQLNRDGLSESSSELTGEGSLMGTPLYMSPEQVEADPEKIGPQTDIYSLGVILYELLCGRVPFEGPVGVVIASVLTKEPEPLSQRQPDVSPALVQICERMMAKKREERYGSMQEVAVDLQKFLKGQLPSGSSESWQVDAKTPSKSPSSPQKPWPLIVGGAVASVLLLAAIPLLFMGDEDKPDDTAVVDVPDVPVPDSPAVTPETNEVTPDDATVEVNVDALAPEETVLTAAFERRFRGGIHEIVRGLEWFPDSKRVLAADYSAQLRVWNVETGEVERTLSLYERGSGCQLVRVTLSPDGRWIVAAVHRNTGDRQYARGDLLLWKDFQYRGVLGTHEHSSKYSMKALDFAPDSRHVVSVADNGYARIWDVETGDEIKVLEHRSPNGSPRRTYDGQFSPDGRLLVTAGFDDLAHVWDIESEEEIYTYAGHGADIFSVAFVGDGRVISAGYNDPWLRVWNPDDPEDEDKFHVVGSQRVTSHPDGRWVAVASQTHNDVTLLDLLTGRSLSLLGHQQPTYRATFSPDGTRLVVSSADRMVSVWKIGTAPKSDSPPEPVDLLKQIQFASGATPGWDNGADGALSATAVDQAIHISMRCSLKGAYRLTTEFTVNETQLESLFSLALPVGPHLGTLAIAPRNAEFTRIEQVPGGTSTDWPMLEIGRRYRLDVDVTPGDERSHIEVSLDGNTVIDWRGDNSRIILGPSTTSRRWDTSLCVLPAGGMNIDFHRMAIESEDMGIVHAPLPDNVLKQRQKLSRPDYADLATGTWQPVLNTPESIADLPGVSLTPDGVEVAVTKAYTGFVLPGVEGRDVIFRARVKDSAGLHYLKFNVRCRFDPEKDRWPAGGCLLETGFATGARRVKLFNSGLGSGNTVTERLCEQVNSPPYEVAIASIGDRLMAYINGHLVNELPTSSVPSARLVGIGMRKTQKAPAKLLLENPEVMVLDSNAAAPSAPAEQTGGLYFRTSKDHAEVESLKYDGADPITIECWTTLLGPHDGLFLLVSNQNNGGMNIRNHSRLWLTAAVGKDNFVATRSLQSPSVVGKRTHVAVAYGDGTYSLFVDGRLAQRETLNHPHTPTTLPFRIGNDTLPHSGQRCQALVHSVRFSRGIRYVDDFTPEETLTSDADTLSLYGSRVQGEEWVDQSYRDHPAFIHGARPVPEAICSDPTGNESDRAADLLKIEHDATIATRPDATAQLALSIDRTQTEGFLRADLTGLPEGMTCLPVIVPPKANSMRLKLRLDAEAAPEKYELRLIIRSERAVLNRPVLLTVVGS